MRLSHSCVMCGYCRRRLDRRWPLLATSRGRLEWRCQTRSALKLGWRLSGSRRLCTPSQHHIISFSLPYRSSSLVFGFVGQGNTAFRFSPYFFHRIPRKGGNCHTFFYQTRIDFPYGIHLLRRVLSILYLFPAAVLSVPACSYVYVR